MSHFFSQNLSRILNILIHLFGSQPRGRIMNPNISQNCRFEQMLCVILQQIWKSSKNTHFASCFPQFGHSSDRKKAVLPNDVTQDPELNEAAHYSNPLASHQYLSWSLILKEEVCKGTGDGILHFQALGRSRYNPLWVAPGVTVALIHRGTRVQHIHTSPAYTHTPKLCLAVLLFRWLFLSAPVLTVFNLQPSPLWFTA